MTLAYSQHFRCQPIVFVDFGNPYHEVEDVFLKPRWNALKRGGLVVAWNLFTLIHLFTARSSEGSTLSLNFMHLSNWEIIARTISEYSGFGIIPDFLLKNKCYSFLKVAFPNVRQEYETWAITEKSKFSPSAKVVLSILQST